MNLKSRFRKLLTVASVSTGLLITASVMANPMLEINTNGCFAVTSINSDACGNEERTENGDLANVGASPDNIVFAKGSFSFWDTLTPIFATIPNAPLAASISVMANATGANPFNFSQDTVFANTAALQADPLFPLALSVYQAVLAGQDLVGDGFTIMYDTIITSQTPDHVTGDFTAWSRSSTTNPDPLAALDAFSIELFGRDLPRIPVSFTADASLVALPEPISLALIGLGLFVMSSSLRRKI